MAKVVRENTQDYKLLYDALLSLKTRKECKAFLEDICTIKDRLPCAAAGRGRYASG